ncbi:MAG: glycine-rich domain-containing protein [Pseudonocardiaceae bacterium]
MTIITADKVSPRAFVSADLFGCVTSRISQEQGIDLRLAERIMDQVPAFLKTCADHPHLSLVPSQAIDSGWHTFVLYTRDYAKFCDRAAGRFIHHEPEDAPARADQEGHMICDTVAVIRASGFEIDEPLWAMEHDPPCRSTVLSG